MSEPLVPPGRMTGYVGGVALLLIGGGFLSMGGLFVRAIAQADGWQILQFRAIGFCLTVLAFIAWRRRGRLVAPFRRLGWAGVACAGFLAFGFIAYVIALTLTTVANAMFVLATSPLFCALAGRVLLGERIGPVTAAAIAIAVAGIAVMVADSLRVGDWHGMLVALCVPVAFAGMVISIRLGGADSDMMPAVLLSGALAGLVALVIGDSPADLPLRDCLLATAMGAVQLAVGFICITLGTRAVPAAEVALLTLTEPILAPVWVWLAFGEVPGHATLVGGAAVLIAVAAQAVAGLARAAEPAPPPG